MIPSFVKHLSSRFSFSRKTSDQQNGEASSVSEPSKKNDTNIHDQDVSSHLASVRTLSKRSSSASKTPSLTSWQTLAGRAPSLTSKSSVESITKKLGNSRKTKNAPTSKTLWYLRGSYVTVRNDKGGWFLCRLQTNVYNTTKSVKIRWLSRKKEGASIDGNDYGLDYRDEIDPACILFNVRVTRDRSTYTLYDEDRLETEKLLKVVTDVASGKLTFDDVDSDVEEVVQIEPPAKKAKYECKKKTDGKGNKSTKKGHNKMKKSVGVKEKEPKQNRAMKADKTERKRKIPKKKEDDSVLHPNPDVELQKKDPFFETNESVPFISKYAHSRLMFRAVNLRDHKLVKKLCKETGKVRKLSHWRSVADNTSALHHAIKLRDRELIKLLYKDFYRISRDNSRERRKDSTPADKLNLTRLQTGSYNYRSLGVEYIRPIMASRGSREGNNALTKDLQDMEEQDEHKLDDYLDHMLTTGLDFDIMKEILADEDLLMSDPRFAYTRQRNYDYEVDEGEETDDAKVRSYVFFKVLKRIDLALERGHYKLAGSLLKDMFHTTIRCKKKMSSLHYSVLMSDEELKNLSPRNVTWGIRVAHRITPVHCAACNPDTRSLEKLLEADPDILVSDILNRRLIHFAAACEGTGPLELLIKRGARLTDVDRLRNIPLHFAVRANRVNNVKLLLEHSATESAGMAEDDPWLVRFGVGGINRPNKNSYTPLHMAVESGHLETVKVLVEKGARLNSTLSMTHFKVTPLMLASQFGFYDIVVFLVESGAHVQQRDRLGRTAVIHAAMNGNTNVLSYLLNIGASPKLCDTSGNSPLHYAAAYGWYFCVQTLLEAGADVNVSNDWKITPLSIAYMKSHTGIVGSLLKESNIDVNFKDDAGMILLSTATSCALIPDLYDQIYYLTKDKGAVCTFKDVDDATPLHHLAGNDVLLEAWGKFPMPSEEAMETSVKIARLLIDHGCDPRAVDKNGMTAVMEAMRTGNVELVKYLVETGCPVLTDLDKDGDNILHDLCYNHMDSMKDYLAILKYAAEMDGCTDTQNLKKAFRDMAQVFCKDDGATPLLLACQQYQICEKSCKKSDPSEDQVAVRMLWERGRCFISFLVEELDSDVNATCQEDPSDPNAKRPWRQWSVAQILSEARNCEYGGLRQDTEPEYPALRMILKYKPNLNTRDWTGYTPLGGRVADEKLVPVSILIKESNADIDAYQVTEKRGRKYNMSIAVIAVLSDNPAIGQLIVDAGADLELEDERDGYKPLHAVAMLDNKSDGRMTLIQTILDRGANVNSLSRKKRTPLHLAVNCNEGKMDDNYDLILALIEKGADLTIRDVQGRIPLHYVFFKLKQHTDTSHHDPLELCRIIVSKMKATVLNIRDKFGMTALHMAAYRGASICCMYLIQKGADLNLNDYDGNTPLSMAVLGKHDGCASILIQEGAYLTHPVVEVNPDTQNNSDDDDDYDDDGGENEKLRPVWELASQHTDEKTDAEKQIPLFESALQRELQGVFFMMMEKPVRESGILFEEAVERALKLGKYNIVLRLLTTTADVSETLDKDCEHGRNLLHVLSLTATNFDSDIEKVGTELVEKGVSLTQQDNYKCTPLLYASLNRNYGLCKFFMKAPKVYNPKYTDSFHRSVFSAAFWKMDKSLDSDFTSWISELNEKKANLNELIDRPVHEGLLGAVDKERDPDYWRRYDCVKISPLIIAIHHLSHEFTQWILKKGANVNLADSAGRTPIMHAVLMNDVVLVKTLMNFDYDPNAKEEEYPNKSKEQTKKNLNNRRFLLKQRSSKLSVEENDDEEDDLNDSEEEKDTSDLEEETLKPYKKVSNVNLSVADRNGWTVLHHAVCPLPFGTFDNHEIVFILAKAGAKLNVKNKKGETPLDMAVNKGAFRIARVIQELQNVPENKRREPTYSSVDVNDNMKWKNPQPSFHEDAERFLDSLEKPMDVEEEYKAKIDSNCNVDNGTLVKDEDQDRLYDVLLSKVDVKRREWGLYNFYQMQLVHQPGKDLYILFTRWGRIGDTGQYQHTPYQAKEAAVKEFCKIFLSKTGNKWMDLRSFEHQSGKYRIVEVKERRQAKSQLDLQFESKNTVKSKLPTYLQHIMKEMISLKSLNTAVNNEAMDTDAMPFGRIERDRLLKARDLLQKIRVLVDEVETYREAKMNREKQKASEKDKYLINCEQIGMLSNEYFQTIPQKDFAMEKIRPLDKRHELAKQIKLVFNLLDYEVASRMLLGAKYSEKYMNPLDYMYQSLGCQIQLLEEDDEESQYILKYISNSSPATLVEAIYRVQVEGEQTRMDRKHLGNHRLLWHGSGIANLLSILHRGLVVTPLDAYYTKHLSDQGIIFSDCFCKSADDCNNQNLYNNTRFMLLCEVALGDCKHYSRFCVPKEKEGKEGKEYHSLVHDGGSTPLEKHDICLPNGSFIPLGEVTRGGFFFSNYNQYFVYDEAQVCLRYIIQYREK